MEWQNRFPFAQVYHECFIGSDHCPLIVNCCHPPKRISRIFKFKSMWSTSPTCEEVIKRAWASPITRSPMHQLTQRLNACKRDLLTWSKTDFGNNKRLIAACKRQLAHIQSLPPTPQNYRDHGVLHSQLADLLTREEMFFHQRSRVNWLLYGDRNTVFFHATLT